MKTALEIEKELAYCCGTESYHRTMRPDTVHTDGVLTLAQGADAFWLIDAIVSHQPTCMKDDSLRFMQFWTLTVKDNSATLICERDTDDVAITQEIEYTDFPLDEIKVWVEKGWTDGREVMVAMLPSER